MVPIHEGYLARYKVVVNRPCNAVSAAPDALTEDVYPPFLSGIFQTTRRRGGIDAGSVAQKLRATTEKSFTHVVNFSSG